MHRDLKPENILLEENKDLDSIKIIDFGLSQCVEKDKELTDMVGSIYYIAPEVLKGSHGSKADIWSCGVIAYILIAGYAPFDGHSDDDIKAEVLSGEFSFEDEIWDDISDQCKNFIETLLELDPKSRPTAEEALEHPWIVECRMASSERLKERESVNERALEALSNLERFNAQSKLKQATCAFIASQLVLKEEKHKIDELFRALDINSNGRLSKDDVRIGYKEVFGKEIGPEMVEEMFERIDYDKTGFIEYSEFVIATMNEKDLLSNDKLKHAFDMFDADGSGHISKDELVEVLSFFQSVDKSLDSDVIDRIVKQVDENDDGEIDFDEFTAMMFKTAEEACEEESSHDADEDNPTQFTAPAIAATAPTAHHEPTPSEPTALEATPSTKASAKDSSAPESSKRSPGQKPPVKRIPGALGTKACLALFEGNIKRNKELGYDSKLFNTKGKGDTPIERLSARLSLGRARRASQAKIRKSVLRPPPSPVNRAKQNGTSTDSRGSRVNLKTIRDRTAVFEELIRKNQRKEGDSSSSFSPATQ